MSVDLQVLDIVIIETRTDHTTGSMNWRSDIFPAFFTFQRHPLASIETSYLESNRCLCSRQNLSKLQPSCHGSCREYDCTNCNSHCGSYLSFVILHLGFSAEILSPFFCAPKCVSEVFCKFLKIYTVECIVYNPTKDIFSIGWGLIYFWQIWGVLWLNMYFNSVLCPGKIAESATFQLQSCQVQSSHQ